MATSCIRFSGIAAFGAMLALMSPSTAHAATSCTGGFVCVYDRLNPTAQGAQRVGIYEQPTLGFQRLTHPQRNFSLVNARVTGRVELKVSWAATGAEATWCVKPGRSTAGPGYILTAVRIGWTDRC
ncbi:hypothetical protein ACFWBH_24985 [Streptomyces sp. NPDC059999]|uniref:hypothetical protein n=1 Tax=Streptomyces sp. NPDC059999 TaxID=3347030 RepID=UPI0036910B5B